MKTELLSAALIEDLNEYAQSAHRDIQHVEIIGYSVERDRNYNSCGCSSQMTMCLSVEYKATTKRGGIRKGTFRIDDEDMWGLLEDAINNIIEL